MFDRIADRYDLLNHVLSFQMDRLWRRRAARVATRGLRGARILDLCTGTGDLAAGLAARTENGSVFAADFSLPMLARAARKHPGLRLAGADAQALPFADAVFDAVTVAFGVRNCEDRNAVFTEILRVLVPSGRFVILEFAPPGHTLLGAGYRYYTHTILPRLAALLARDQAAYRYLPASVDCFPTSAVLAGELRDAGFERVDFEALALGTVAIHCARKNGTSPDAGTALKGAEC